MNKRFLLLAIFLLPFFPAAAMELKVDSIQIGSVVYTNVVITRVNPADVYFQHTGGMANVKLRQLDPRLQRKFNFDPDRAANKESDTYLENEEYKRRAIRSWNESVKKRQAEAVAGQLPPFTVVDPLSAHSPLNQPAPAYTPQAWFSEKPAELAGKFTLLYFWNSYSVPCQEATPSLNQLAKSHTNDLVVIALTTETAQEMQPSTSPIEFFSGSAPDAKTASALDLSTVPSVALIDPKGIVRYTGHPAALNNETLGKLMSRYSAE